MQDLIGKTLGNFEILEHIGQGGMAQVFKAFQPGLDRLVAVKVLVPTLARDPGFTARFQREARSVARLHHPNVVQVHDFGVQDEYYYLVMRYVEDSKTLADLIEEGTPEEQLIDYVVQIADALNYAHKRGIIHRDVKPTNILIDGRWALLTDFGLVKLGKTASDLTRTGIGMGTPAYMSPEQAIGEKVDTRSDLYSLGIILYQILTGKVPHDATTPQAILTKRTIEPALPLREINPNISESLEQVCLRALAKDPNRRYSTAGDFAEAITKAQQDPLYRDAAWDRATILDIEPLPPVELNGDKKKRWLIIGGVIIGGLIIAALFYFLLFPQITENDEVVASEAEAAVITSGLNSTSELDTPTPPSDTPSFTPSDVPLVEVISELPVRSSPYEEDQIRYYLPTGAEVDLIGRDRSGQWLQVRTTQGEGWIKTDSSAIEVTGIANVPIIAIPTPTVPPTETPPPTSTLAPPSPTSSNTPEPATPTPTSSLTPTATSTRHISTVTPGTQVSPTATKPIAPTGQFTLLKPVSIDEVSTGLTEFEWRWDGSLAENQGFEVRVWREGEPPAGVHHAVLDNQQGKVVALDNNTYRLVADITDAPSVRGRSGEYLWTVLLVQISPEYKELGIQARMPGHLRFAKPGSGSDGDGGGGGGGGGAGFG